MTPGTRASERSIKVNKTGFHSTSASKVLMMWGVTLIFVCCVAAEVSSHEIAVECDERYDLPSVGSKASPSLLADLKVELVTVGGKAMLNISWAVNIDASIDYLTGTWIEIEGEPAYLCKYNPPLAKANLTGSEQKWFHYLIQATYGYNFIQAANLPLPPVGSGLTYKVASIEIPHRAQSTRSPPLPTVSADVRIKDVTLAVFGGLAGLLLLGSFFIISENSAFQRAVVALAEFLQWHGGCSVAIDMWQQGKIAELGPIRWLAEQAQTAHRVLIVCPQVKTPSSQPSLCPLNHSFPEPSIPAAARDLYPLILNMVASCAKSGSELAKFWVVQLGEQRDKRTCLLPLELTACKTFCLMKDLKTLCKSLHAQRQDDKKISDLMFRPGVWYGEKSTAKLREAVENLREHKPSISRKEQPMKSVITTV